MHIDEIELRRLDLTVLLVFLNLMRLRKASDVADHMRLTQSSISHSIKRLRESFGDPLFLRTPKGMEPTAVAIALEPRIRGAVATLAGALNAPAPFDPATAKDTLRLGAYDYEMCTLVPSLLREMNAQAPGMRMSLLPLGRRPALEALEQGDIDLALGFAWTLPRAIRKVDLLTERYSVVLRRDHPFAAQDMDLKTYLRADHLVVSPRGDLVGIVDEVLGKAGHHRNVVAAVPQFLPAVSIVAATDLIATLPVRLAASQADRYDLVVRPPPISIRDFTISALYHERNANNPLLGWIVSLLSRTVDVVSK